MRHTKKELQYRDGSLTPRAIIEKDRIRTKNKTKKAQSRVSRVTEGSGNVFADLGLIG